MFSNIHITHRVFFCDIHIHHRRLTCWFWFLSQRFSSSTPTHFHSLQFYKNVKTDLVASRFIHVRAKSYALSFCFFLRCSQKCFTFFSFHLSLCKYFFFFFSFFLFGFLENSHLDLLLLRKSERDYSDFGIFFPYFS